MRFAAALLFVMLAAPAHPRPAATDPPPLRKRRRPPHPAKRTFETGPGHPRQTALVTGAWRRNRRSARGEGPVGCRLCRQPLGRVLLGRVLREAQAMVEKLITGASEDHADHRLLGFDAVSRACRPPPSLPPLPSRQACSCWVPCRRAARLLRDRNLRRARGPSRPRGPWPRCSTGAARPCPLLAVVFSAMLIAASRQAEPPPPHAAREITLHGLLVWRIVLVRAAVGLAAVCVMFRPRGVPASSGRLIESGFSGGHGTAACSPRRKRRPRARLGGGSKPHHVAGRVPRGTEGR